MNTIKKLARFLIVLGVFLIVIFLFYLIGVGITTSRQTTTPNETMFFAGSVSTICFGFLILILANAKEIIKEALRIIKEGI